MSQRSLRRPSFPRVPRFSHFEYEQNPNLIQRTYDAYFDHAEELEKYIKELEDKLEVSEKEVLKLKYEIDNGIGLSIIQSILLIIGAVLSAFGVNLATSSPTQSAGWILSIGGYSIQLLIVLIFAFMRFVRHRRGEA